MPAPTPVRYDGHALTPNATSNPVTFDSFGEKLPQPLARPDGSSAAIRMPLPTSKLEGVGKSRREGATRSAPPRHNAAVRLRTFSAEKFKLGVMANRTGRTIAAACGGAAVLALALGGVGGAGVPYTNADPSSTEVPTPSSPDEVCCDEAPNVFRQTK